MREQTIVWRDDFDSIPVKPISDCQSTSVKLLLRTEDGKICTGHMWEVLTTKIRFIISDSEEIDDNVGTDPFVEWAFLE